MFLRAQEDMPTIRCQPAAISSLERQLREQSVQTADGNFPTLPAWKLVAKNDGFAPPLRLNLQLQFLGNRRCRVDQPSEQCPAHQPVSPGSSQEDGPSRNNAGTILVRHSCLAELFSAIEVLARRFMFRNRISSGGFWRAITNRVPDYYFSGDRGNSVTGGDVIIWRGAIVCLVACGTQREARLEKLSYQ